MEAPIQYAPVQVVAGQAPGPGGSVYGKMSDMCKRNSGVVVALIIVLIIVVVYLVAALKGWVSSPFSPAASHEGGRGASGKKEPARKSAPRRKSGAASSPSGKESTGDAEIDALIDEIES